MKRAFAAIIAILFILVSGAFIAPNFIDLKTYKKTAIDQIQSQTGLELDISGDLAFSVLPSPRFKVGNVTVKAPKGSKSETFAFFELLDVHVAFMPLLSGQVQVSSITIMKPSLNLERFDTGTLNFITPEIESLISGGNQKNGKNFDISLENVNIKSASFSFYDHKEKNELLVQNINADLSATTLQGPFKAEGSLFYEGNAINFGLKTDKYNAENKILSPEVNVTLNPSNIKLDYAGVVSFEDQLSVQGKTTLYAEDLNEVFAGLGMQSSGLKNMPLKSSGLLTANTQQIDYKNFELEIGDQKAAGSLRIDLEPLKYTLSFATPSKINVSSYLSEFIAAKTAEFDISIAGNATKAEIKNTSITLDDHSFKISGNYEQKGKGERSKAQVTVFSPNLDFDQLQSKLKSVNSAKTSVLEQMRALSLPIDLAFDFTAGNFVWNGKKIKDLAVSTNFAENAFVLSKLSAQNIAGASLEVSAKITEINKVPEIEGYFNLDTQDMPKFMSFINYKEADFPSAMKAANIKSKFSGNTNALSVSANMNVMGGEVIFKGDVERPLEEMSLHNTALQLKHKNMSQFLDLAAGIKFQDKNLAKPLDVYAQIDQSGNTYEIKNLKGNLSGISVEGELSANLSAAVPKLSGDLHFGHVNLASVMQTTSSASAAPSTQKSAPQTTRWSKEPINISALHSVNMDINLSAKHIDYGAWPLVEPKLEVQIHNGTMKISNMKAGVFDGNLAFSASVKTVKEARQPLYFESTMMVEGANLKPLSSALIGTQLVDVSGVGNVDMTLNSSGVSSAALIHDLGGEGKVTGQSIILDGIDVVKFARALSEESKAGDTALGIWKGARTKGRTEFDTLDGAFKIQNGIIGIEKMDMDGTEAAIETRGSINLPNWTLATKHKITVKGSEDVPSDVPPFEISFNGSLDNPAQTFGQGLLNDYLSRKIERKLNKIITDKLGVPANNNATPEQQQPAAGDEDTTEQEQQKQGPPQKQQNLNDVVDDIAEEAIKGVLEGLLR